MNQPITWTAWKLESFEEAIALAIGGGLDTVTWIEREKPSRWSKGQEHVIPISEATSIIVQVRAEFSNNPTPTFGENREGEEP